MPAPPTQWLVWTQGESGAVTVRFEDDGAGGARAVGSAPGTWIAVDGPHPRLWEFAVTSVQALQTDCDCVAAGETADCDRAADFDAGVLRPTGGGDALGLPSPDAIVPQTLGVATRLDGTVGPFAFVTSCTERYFCGAAHPDSVCGQRIIDLRTGAEVGPDAMCAAPLDGPAARELMRAVYEDETELEELGEDSITLTRVAPTYDGDAVPRMEEQYTAPTCYACSDGMWDAYTVSSVRSTEALPAALSAWLSQVPRPPEAALSSASTPVAGWSVVPGDSTVRQSLDAVFVPEP